MAELFGQYKEIIIGDTKIQSEDIDFRIYFDTEPEPSMAEIFLYNLSKSTESKIKKDTNIILNAGYRGDIGTLLAGIIKKPASTWEGVDKVVKIYALDTIEKWYTATVNKAYAPGIKASHIIKDVFANYGLEIGEIALTDDITYLKGKSISGSIQNVVKGLAKDCSSKFYIKNGIGYVRPESKGTVTGFLLNSDTGLIGTPSRIDDEEGKIDYDVFMLLNHRIREDSLLKIESKTANGIFRVVKGEHIGYDFITHVEVKAV